MTAKTGKPRPKNDKGEAEKDSEKSHEEEGVDSTNETMKKFLERSEED